jgi:hypothetical protein
MRNKGGWEVANEIYWSQTVVIDFLFSFYLAAIMLFLILMLFTTVAVHTTLSLAHQTHIFESLLTIFWVKSWTKFFSSA